MADTNNQIRESMRKMGFTNNGIDMYIEVKDNYPNLLYYYSLYMGNFGLSKRDLIENAEDIARFIQNHNDYVLTYQEVELDEDRIVCWWLTEKDTI